MRFKPPNCKRLQGAADARRRARRRTFVLQVPDNKADAVPCERLQKLRVSTAEIASRLGLTQPAVNIAARRGDEIATQKGYSHLDK
jgi:hypothetical protein